VKGEVVAIPTMKTYSRCRIVFPLTCNLGCGWKPMVNLTPPPTERNQMPIEYDAGQIPEMVCTFWRRATFFAPAWNQTPDCPVQSLVQGCQTYGMHAQNATYKECLSM